MRYNRPALPLEELAGRARRVGRAEPLVGAVAAVVVGVAPPGLEDAALVVALELVRLAPVGPCGLSDEVSEALVKCYAISANYKLGY